MYYFPFSIRFLKTALVWGPQRCCLLSPWGPQHTSATAAAAVQGRAQLPLYALLPSAWGMEHFSYKLWGFVLVFIALQSQKYSRHMENTRQYHCCLSLIGELSG